MQRWSLRSPSGEDRRGGCADAEMESQVDRGGRVERVHLRLAGQPHDRAHRLPFEVPARLRGADGPTGVRTGGSTSARGARDAAEALKQKALLSPTYSWEKMWVTSRGHYGMTT